MRARITPKQQEVLNLLIVGRPNKIIAYQLGIKESTVKVHIKNLMAGFKAGNRTELAYLYGLSLK